MKEKITLEEILSGKHPTFQTNKLKTKLLDAGLKTNTCEECGCHDSYNGKPLTMHLDHIDGNNSNHQLINLRMLCPNCHSQTPTYSGRNRTNSFRTKLKDRAEARRLLKIEHDNRIQSRNKAKNLIVSQRLADLEKMKFGNGTIAELSKKWNVSHTQVRRFILDNKPDFIAQ